MCGIAGLRSPEISEKAADEFRRRAASVLLHRGPDDSGAFRDGDLTLVHRRLAVIDPTGSRQPMTLRDRPLTIVYNGELYNYVELRDELSRLGVHFDTNGDTEVLLRAWAVWGEDCLRRLNGIFAFAVWDGGSRELFLARDPLGVKPLYFVSSGETFAFASEIKVFTECGLLKAEPNPRGLLEYLALQCYLGDETLLKGVRRVMPGECVIVTNRRELTRKRYWRPPSETTLSDGGQTLGALIEDAVRMQLRSDVALGAHLSGGLDTATVVAFCRSHVRDLHTFTAGFADIPGDGGVFDDRAFARRTAEALGTTHHEVAPTAEEFAQIMPWLAWISDEPMAGSGLFPQWCVSRLARRHVTVALGGQGADEIAGGYARHLILYRAEAESGRTRIPQENLVDADEQLEAYEPLIGRFRRATAHDPSFSSRFFALVAREGLRPSSRILSDAAGFDARREFDAVISETEHEEPLQRMLHFETTRLLPALLHVEDRASMACSLESRVPLLDTRIVERLFRTPVEKKFARGRLKCAIRNAVRGVVPDFVIDRRRKIGFPVPLVAWRNGPLARWFDDLGSSLALRDLVVAEDVKKILENPDERGLWGIISLELWARAFLDGTRPAPPEFGGSA